MPRRAGVGVRADTGRVPGLLQAPGRPAPDRARALAIGCGTGRFAAELFGPPHFFTGAYRGSDVGPLALGWAARRFRSTVADVHFDLLDVRNTHYNPDGKIVPEEAIFPYDVAAFDFAFAMSVFTHLAPATAERYLHKLGRVLRPPCRPLVGVAHRDVPTARPHRPGTPRERGPRCQWPLDGARHGHGPAPSSRARGVDAHVGAPRDRHALRAVVDRGDGGWRRADRPGSALRLLVSRRRRPRLSGPGRARQARRRCTRVGPGSRASGGRRPGRRPGPTRTT